jgi:hypothetical protein
MLEPGIILWVLLLPIRGFLPERLPAFVEKKISRHPIIQFSTPPADEDTQA